MLQITLLLTHFLCPLIPAITLILVSDSELPLHTVVAFCPLHPNMIIIVTQSHQFVRIFHISIQCRRVTATTSLASSFVF